MKKKASIASVASMTLLGLSQSYAAFNIDPGDPSVPTSIQNKVQVILGMVQWIGFIVGVAMIMYVGIKYLTAGAGQKAEVKSTMVPILVGAILVMLAPQIAGWIFSF